MVDVVTLGESMALLTGTSIGPLRHTATLRLSIAGAESNLAIGLARLGHDVAWIGRVGDDEFGRLVVDRLRGEGVDVAGAVVDDGAPTGLMVKQRRTATTAEAHYYRAGSAGSRLEPGDLDESLLAGARVLHLTGITPALGDGPRRAVHQAIEVVAAAGGRIAFDPNYRAALWSPDEARPVLRDLARRADILLSGDDEALLLVDEEDPERAVERLAELGPAEVVVKRGAEGALALDDGVLRRQPVLDVVAVDPVGAGDGFAAGYLSARLDGETVVEALRRGAAVGACVVAAEGDWEGLPRRDELHLASAAAGDVVR